MPTILLNLRSCGAPLAQDFLRKYTVLLLLVALSNCAQAGDVKLYAAASLTDALTELSSIYQKSHPDIVIQKAFAGSSTLAKQIDNGAPADIFMSADNDWADYLQKRGLLISESRKTIVSNELVLIAPIGSEAKVIFDSGFNLSASFTGRLCTGDTASVPVGKYAKQSLLYYKWWDTIASRIVGTDDVRTALAFVERAECSLGIVYKTDAELSKKIKIVGIFPSASHSSIEYPGGLIKKVSAVSAEAKSFWIFLQSDDAKGLFSRYGFTPIK